MLKVFPTKPMFNHTTKMMVPSLALLLCTACGGGSSSSSSSTPAPTAVSVNQAPVASASSQLSIVSEGQKFELDASGSTDADGDSLTYSWRQLSGPEIEMVSSTRETLSLTAPLLDDDSDVLFELTVSDGAGSDVSMVSLNIENLKVDEVQSDVTEFGPGEPLNPTETVPVTSVFEGNRPLSRIIGLTPETDGGYRVHWTAFYSGQNNPVSSQAFSSDGERVGAQTDGVFIGSPPVPFERDEDGQFIFDIRFGLNFATLQSGDTLFNLNGEFAFTNASSTIDYTSHRGLVEGEIDGMGDSIFQQIGLNGRNMGGAFAPVGQDEVLLILGERTTDDVDDVDANVILNTYIVDALGQTRAHSLDPYVSNGTVVELNGMTATGFNGDSYLTAWALNTPDADYDIRMQRSTLDGVILGAQEAVNEDVSGPQFQPRSVTLPNGNIVVTWLSLIEGEEAMFEIRARVVQPDGGFVTDEMTLGGRLFYDFTQRPLQIPSYEITALNTNEVLVTWEESLAVIEETTDDQTPVNVAAEDIELQAMAFDAELNGVSNLFTLATDGAAENISRLIAITLPDNRVVLGWYNDFPFNDDREDTSHTISFYPVGR